MKDILNTFDNCQDSLNLFVCWFENCWRFYNLFNRRLHQWKSFNTFDPLLYYWKISSIFGIPESIHVWFSIFNVHMSICLCLYARMPDAHTSICHMPIFEYFSIPELCIEKMNKLKKHLQYWKRLKNWMFFNPGGMYWRIEQFENASSILKQIAELNVFQSGRNVLKKWKKWNQWLQYWIWLQHWIFYNILLNSLKDWNCERKLTIFQFYNTAPRNWKLSIFQFTIINSRIETFQFFNLQSKTTELKMFQSFNLSIFQWFLRTCKLSIFQSKTQLLTFFQSFNNSWLRFKSVTIYIYIYIVII